MNEFLLSQIIAAIAFTCGVISYQLRARRSILLWLSGSSIVNACHFFVLGRAAPGILFLIIGARSLTAAFSINRKIMYVFVGLILIGFFCSYKSPLGFLGLFGTLSGTYGSFQKTEQGVRVFHMLANASWMAHNILVMTPVAAIMEATFLTSNVLGYWRFHRRDEAARRRDLAFMAERTG